MSKPIVINVRGTSGSGKSTLVRSVMEAFSNKQAFGVSGRKQPLLYTLDPDLVVLGHYEGACGGCDTISKHIEGVYKADPSKVNPNSYDTIFGLVRDHHAAGKNVLYEGLLISGDVARTKALHVAGIEVHVVALDLPIEFCIQSVLDRRAAKGVTTPFNEENTRAKHKLMETCLVKLQGCGVPVHRFGTREHALDCVLALLGKQPLTPKGLS